MISYIKLVKKLRENNISQYKLKQEKILGSATITKIFRNDGLNGESIDIKVVDKMCKLLLILRILKTGISLEAMPPWVSENGFSSFQAVC